MRKVSEPEKKLIASLVASGQSIEFIKEKYKVAERQINSYVKKYSDDESFLVSHKLIDTPTEEKINNNLLTEEYIMENHLKLREYIDDKYETKKEFIKRQLTIPILDVNPKDNEFFMIRMIQIDESKWNLIEPFHDRLWIYPDKSSFLNGELIYYVNQHLYVKSTFIAKKGFKRKSEDEKTVFSIENPLKLYKSEKYRVIKKAYYSLDKILKQNNLNLMKNRSEAFNQWLHDEGYLQE